MKKILIVGLFLIGSIAALIYSFKITLIVLLILCILTVVLFLKGKPSKSNPITSNIEENELSTFQEELPNSKMA